MYNKIDWISFSFYREFDGDGDVSRERFYLYEALNELLGDYNDLLIGWAELEQHGGRAPYLQRFHNPRTRVNVFWHPMLSHALVEMGGQACDWLGANGHTGTLLEKVKHRVTRIDLARDIPTSLDPIVFAGQRDTQRFRSHSEFVSESGITAYVGSRTSNRYARVYRYHPPHERAHLLRVEMVSKAEDAKIMAQALIDNGVVECVATLGSKFGWLHPSWNNEQLPTFDLPAYRPERREGKTLFWLADTVAPLLLRLEDEGVIDIDLWIADHLTPKRKRR